MATTGIIPGRLWDLLHNAAVIDHLMSVSLTIGTDTYDITSYDSSNWKDIQTGDNNWSVSADFLVAYDATEGFDEIVADQIARNAVTLLLSTEETGDTTLSGSAYVTSANYTGDLGSGKKASVTWTGNGALTQGTVGA